LQVKDEHLSHQKHLDEIELSSNSSKILYLTKGTHPSIARKETSYYEESPLSHEKQEKELIEKDCPVISYPDFLAKQIGQYFFCLYIHQ
jgi:hypothetical protein